MANRSGLMKLVALGAAGYLAYQFLFSPPESGAPPAVGSGADRPPLASYALRAENSWPTLDEAGQSAAAVALFTANYYVLLDGSGSMNEVLGDLETGREEVVSGGE